MQIRYEHYECESRHCILWARSCSSNLESNNVVKSVAYIYCLSDWTFEASCFFLAFIVSAYAKPSEDCSFPSVFYGNLRSPDSFQSLLDLWKIYKVGLDPLSMILGILHGPWKEKELDLSFQAVFLCFLTTHEFGFSVLFYRTCSQRNASLFLCLEWRSLRLCLCHRIPSFFL